MKNIKYFKYKSTEKITNFLSSFDYSLEDVVGFSLSERKQYNYNILTEYCIHFKDDECEYFRVVCFKDFHAYHQARLGFSDNKLLRWYEDADVREYKTKGF